MLFFELEFHLRIGKTESGVVVEGAELGDDGSFGSSYHKVFGFGFVEMINPTGGHENCGIDCGGVLLTGWNFHTFGKPLSRVLLAE